MLFPALVSALVSGGSPAAALDVLDVRPDKGFDHITLDIGGFAQPRFAYVPEDEAAGAPGTYGFIISRARFELNGELSEDKGGFALIPKISVEMAPEPRLFDFMVNIRAHRLAQFQVGQYKTPTSRTLIVSDRRTLFPERGEIDNLGPRRDMGAMLHGASKRNVVEYAVGAYNGEGTNRLENVNRKFLTVARLAVSPIGGPGTREELLHVDDDPTFSLGGIAYRNIDGPEGQEMGLFALNGEAFAHWRWVTAQAELLHQTIDWQDPSIADYTAGGWYVQAGVWVPGSRWTETHLALVGKVQEIDRYDPLRDEVPLTGPTDPAQRTRITSGGVGYYLGAPWLPSLHDLRIQLIYDHYDEREGQPYDNDALTLAGHFTF